MAKILQNALLVMVMGGLWLSGCGYEHSDENDYKNKLSVKLEWENAVNLNLKVQEPTGEWIGTGTNGPTMTSIGDNTCGFGPLCNPQSCSDSPCDSYEGVYATSIASGTYTIQIQNNGLAQYDPVEEDFVGEDVELSITIPENLVEKGNAYYMLLSCYILNNTAPKLAVVEFSTPERGKILMNNTRTQCVVSEVSYK
jgi:hypothetical protein